MGVRHLTYNFLTLCEKYRWERGQMESGVTWNTDVFSHKVEKTVHFEGMSNNHPPYCTRLMLQLCSREKGKHTLYFAEGLSMKKSAMGVRWNPNSRNGYMTNILNFRQRKHHYIFLSHIFNKYIYNKRLMMAKLNCNILCIYCNELL